MLNKIKEDNNDTLARLVTLRKRVVSASTLNNDASNDVLKSIAMSTVLEGELKELLIILHTTTMTEMSEARINTYITNAEFIDIIDRAISTQSDTLALLPPTSNVIIEILKTYKLPISLIAIFLLGWLALSIDYDNAIILLEHLNFNGK